jgi:hypothetical protein
MTKPRSIKFLMVLLVGVAAGIGSVNASSELSPDAPANLGLTTDAAAADPAAVPAEVLILRSIEKELKEKLKKDVFRPSNIPSLVFTPSQHAMLSDARRGFNTRMPTPAELRPGDAPSPDDPNYRAPPSVRKLSLGGIVFNNPDEWTIYLNNKRITPDAMPSEAVDLRVYKDFIELRWFDVQTNQIFPVRLRPNQTFNLDGRVFLPG